MNNTLLFERTQTYSRRWVFGFITNNPIRVDPLTVENEFIGIIKGTNGKRFKVRSPVGRFCDISEIFFGKMKLITRKFKCKNSERNKGSEHVFNPIVNVRFELRHVVQYPIINTREVHIPL